MAKEKMEKSEVVTENITGDEEKGSGDNEMLTAGADKRVTEKPVRYPQAKSSEDKKIDAQYISIALRFLVAKALSPSEMEDFVLNFPKLFE